MARSRGFPGFVFFVNPFTCHLLCTEGNNGVGGWDMQELFTLLARRGQWMLSTRAGGRSLTDNPTTVIPYMTWHENEAGKQEIEGKMDSQLRLFR